MLVMSNVGIYLIGMTNGKSVTSVLYFNVCVYFLFQYIVGLVSQTIEPLHLMG